MSPERNYLEHPKRVPKGHSVRFRNILGTSQQELVWWNSP